MQRLLDIDKLQKIVEASAEGGLFDQVVQALPANERTARIVKKLDSLAHDARIETAWSALDGAHSHRTTSKEFKRATNGDREIERVMNALEKLDRQPITHQRVEHVLRTAWAALPDASEAKDELRTLMRRDLNIPVFPRSVDTRSFDA